MNGIIKYIKGKQGYKLRNRAINTVCYADDGLLTADNEDGPHRLLGQY
jgi:hypothetical protein